MEEDPALSGGCYMKDAVIRGVLLLDTYRIFKSKFQVTSVTLWQCKKCAVTRPDISQASFADRGSHKDIECLFTCSSGDMWGWCGDARLTVLNFTGKKLTLWFIAHGFVGGHCPCFMYKMQSGGWPYPKGRYKLFKGIASLCSRPSFDMMLISLTLDNWFLVMFKVNRN